MPTIPKDLPPFDIERQATIVAGEPGPGRQPEDGTPPGMGSPLMGIGVRRADGTKARFGTDVFLHRRSRPVRLDALVTAPAHRAGRCIYGGVIGPGFGHLLTQSTGRLWLCDLFPEAPLLFVSSRHGLTSVPAYFEQVLRQLGIGNPVELICQPLQVEELVLGEELCNLHRRPSVMPQFPAWLRAHRPAAPIETGLRLYVSRARLDLANGQFLQESVLEAFLVQQGYRVIHPETLSIAEQMRAYGSAEKLIFADGSAVHLWSLIASPDQQAAMILRRPLDSHIARWFQGLPDVKLDYLDTRMADFSRRGGPSNTSVALLDLQAVCAALRRLGFLATDDVIGPPRAMLETWLARMERGRSPLRSAPPDLDERSRQLIRRRPGVKSSATPEHAVTVARHTGDQAEDSP